MLKKERKKQTQSLHVSIATQVKYEEPRSHDNLKSTNQENYLVDTQSYFNKFTIDEKQKNNLQEIKDEQLNILSLNHWKRIRNSTNSFSHQSLNRLLNQGKFIQEDKNDTYLQPNINTKLIQTICQDLPEIPDLVVDDEEQVPTSQSRKFAMLQNSGEVRPQETQELQRKHINQKLINKILFNKLSKNLVSSLKAKQSTSEVLNSFKSLTQMFKTVHQLINYEEIYNEIIQASKIPQRLTIITKEFDRDLERQQQNFNDIVSNKLKVIKEQSDEVEEKRKNLNELRVENCLLREQSAAVFQEIESIRKRYLKGMSQLFQVEDRYGRQDKKQQLKVVKMKIYLELLKDTEEKETNQMITLMSQIKQGLSINSQEIEQQEKILNNLQDQKNNSKLELIEFLKTVLKNEEIQIQESLVSIIKYLQQVKANVTLADFPNYLDIHSRQYLQQKGVLDLQIDEMRKKVKQQQQKIKFSEVKVQGQPNFFQKELGNRPFYEQKLKEVKEAFSSMKKQNRAQKNIQDSQISLIGIGSKKKFFLDSNQEKDSDFKNINDIQKVQQQQVMVNEIEKQSDTMEKNEISRLRNLYSQKQLGLTQIQRLVKTVQSEFGAKRMKTILSEILNEQKSNKVNCLIFPMIIKDAYWQNIVQVNQERKEAQQEDDSKDKLKIITKYKEKQKYLIDQLESHQDINYFYDPIYNQLPSLQNRYTTSSFFPKEQ